MSEGTPREAKAMGEIQVCPTRRGTKMNPILDAMVRELRELSSDVRQHESLMRARWGRDYSDEIFEEAAAIVEHERAVEEDS